MVRQTTELILLILLLSCQISSPANRQDRLWLAFCSAFYAHQSQSTVTRPADLDLRIALSNLQVIYDLSPAILLVSSINWKTHLILRVPLPNPLTRWKITTLTHCSLEFHKFHTFSSLALFLSRDLFCARFFCFSFAVKVADFLFAFYRPFFDRIAEAAQTLTGGSLIENSLSEFFSTFQLFWPRFVSQFLVVFFFSILSFCAKKRVSHIGFRFTSLSLALALLYFRTPNQGSPFFGVRFVRFRWVEFYAVFT